MGYLSVQNAVLVASLYWMDDKNRVEVHGYLKKVVNYLLIFTVKVMSGPALSFLVRIFYCNPRNNLLQCYSASHIGRMVIGVIIFVLIIKDILIYSLFYFFQNPFSLNYMSERNRYYQLSKTIIKVFVPICFSLDS